ncbi:DUF6314 family protein [Candidatus Tisiphia endosymbiont of Nemotelus uliginosus]|uniref:DUF6314 family protein n=1 Tax=Candidatus Tisiphia endosymbiont of Nemotelus uliginosus TaxID=3077926 RepID=UPI0035C89814
MTNKLIKNIFYSLIGTYSIRRILGNRGTGEGTAHCAQYNPTNKQDLTLYNSTESRILYREELILNYYNNKGKTKGLRKYWYILRDNTITKYFCDDNDNTLFYQIHFNATDPLQAEGIHKCNLDIYTARYIFYSPRAFELHYDVLGPDKNYTIKTSYIKI